MGAPGPGPEAVAALRERLAELVDGVNAKFRVDERFECGPFPCELHEMVCDLQRRFGRALAGIYEFGLLDRLEAEFLEMVRPVMNRGAMPEFPSTVLDAWLMVLRTGLPSGFQDELARPLSALRSELPGRWENDEPPPLDGDTGRLFELASERRRRTAADFLVEKVKGADPGQVLGSLIVPVLARVGELWAQNRMSAAEEHGATEVCRYAMLRALDSIEPSSPGRGRALVACAPGEEHEMGAEMVAGLLELDGWEVFFVGRSAPEGEIVSAARRFGSKLALLSSATMATLPGLRDLARALRGAVPGVKLVAGGDAAVLARDRLAGDFDRVVVSALEGRAAAAELAG